MAVYFFYGDEDYNIELELDKMRSNLNPDFISMSYQVLDNPNYSLLINALRTPPMMFGEMLIVINAEEYFLGNGNKFEDEELEDIDNALKNNQDSINVVFVVRLPRNEGKKIDSRRKLYKILAKYNSREFKTFSTFYPKEIENWVSSRAKAKKISFKDDALEFLVEQIGNDLRQFDTELEKLVLIAYPDKIVTKSMVEEICISNQDLFNLTNDLMNNEKDKALLEFKKLLDKKHPLEILAALQTMLRQWIVIKTTSSVQDAMRLTGINNEKRIAYIKKDLKNVSIKDLVSLKENLHNAEYNIKSGSSVDIVSEVECAIIR